MNVAEARGCEPGTAVSVTGFLVEDSGLLVVCDALAESFPPQPGGASIEVVERSIDELGQPGLVRHQAPMRWLDEPVTLTGTIDGDRLVDAERA